MRFAQLRLAEPIVAAVAAEGYSRPTPIQARAIPVILAGHDVLGCAQTGTGKTAAFALPILQRLAARSGGGGRGRPPRALVLCPTRELASQITESFRVYGSNLALRHAVVFGGVGQGPQVAALRSGIDVLVATPGRLLDLIGQRAVDLRAIEVLVLDEADRMLDMGFIDDIRRIVGRLPERRQNLLFSATMPDEIRRLAASILHEPVAVHVDPVASTVETVEQSVHFVARTDKPALLAELLRRGDVGRTLVFARTKHRADRVARDLRKAGIAALTIHGNKSQSARTRALDGFKSGHSAVLVATDIASRGIDVDEITHVINYDIPEVAETYVHRIGRTARAGAPGVAITFCQHDQRRELAEIERLIGVRLVVHNGGPSASHAAPAPIRPAPRPETRPAPKARGPLHRHRRSGSSRSF